MLRASGCDGDRSSRSDSIYYQHRSQTGWDNYFTDEFIATDNHHVGLGLMLVSPLAQPSRMEIVELHGGVLSCQTIIGQGSHTQVSLPQICLVPAESLRFALTVLAMVELVDSYLCRNRFAF